MRQTRPYFPGATLRLPVFRLGSPAGREPGRWGRELRLRLQRCPVVKAQTKGLALWTPCLVSELINGPTEVPSWCESLVFLPPGAGGFWQPMKGGHWG